MKVFQAITSLKGFAKRFPFIVLIVFHPLLLCAAAPWVYVTNNRSDSLTIINTVTDEVLNTIPVGKEPHEVAITPDGKRILVCNAQDDTISVIDANIEVATITTERFPHGVAITPNGERAYVVNFLADSITVIDVKNAQVLEIIKDINSNPRNISITRMDD